METKKTIKINVLSTDYGYKFTLNGRVLSVVRRGRHFQWCYEFMNNLRECMQLPEAIDEAANELKQYYTRKNPAAAVEVLFA